MFDRILDMTVGRRRLLYGGYCAYTQEYAQEAENEPVFYTAAEKRDPFLSAFYTAQKQVVVREAKTPLQLFDLSQLKVVGIISETCQPKALIEDSSGLDYIVEAGTLIGSNGGGIKLVEARRIVAEEFETDFYDKREVKQRELDLMIVNSTPNGGGTNGKK